MVLALVISVDYCINVKGRFGLGMLKGSSILEVECVSKISDYVLRVVS